jgi:hypothetical protein
MVARIEQHVVSANRAKITSTRCNGKSNLEALAACRSTPRRRLPRLQDLRRSRSATMGGSALGIPSRTELARLFLTNGITNQRLRT